MPQQSRESVAKVSETARGSALTTVWVVQAAAAVNCRRSAGPVCERGAMTSSRHARLHLLTAKAAEAAAVRQLQRYCRRSGEKPRFRFRRRRETDAAGRH